MIKHWAVAACMKTCPLLSLSPCSTWSLWTGIPWFVTFGYVLRRNSTTLVSNFLSTLNCLSCSLLSAYLFFHSCLFKCVAGVTIKSWRLQTCQNCTETRKSKADLDVEWDYHSTPKTLHMFFCVRSPAVVAHYLVDTCVLISLVIVFAWYNNVVGPVADSFVSCSVSCYHRRTEAITLTTAVVGAEQKVAKQNHVVIASAFHCMCL